METNTIKQQFSNVYADIAAGDDYQRNNANLKLIQVCVVTVSAIATGYVNAFAHKERLGVPLSVLLAALIMGFVEKFYFTLRHGLTTTYKAGKQRLYAQICYRTMQATMILNAAVLCAWIVGLPLPFYLRQWFHWSIAVHFALALLGVAAVRDADSVVENRMLELKAATARQDVVTIRKAAAIGNPLVLLAAKLRGFLDAWGLAWKLSGNRSNFAGDYLKQIDQIAADQFGHIDGDEWPTALREKDGQNEQRRPP